LSTGRGIDKKLSVYIIGDAVKQGLNIPFSNFRCCGAGMIKGLSGQKRWKGVLTALIGVLVFLPLIAAVTNLLVSADQAFESFIVNIAELVNFYTIITYIGQFIVGIPVAFYLYGLIYGNVKGRHDEKITSKSVDNAAEIVKIAPKLTIYSGLTAFNIIYLVFFAVQATYLFSAFGGNLPEAYTYAEYARRGFFEICAVAGINLFVITVSHMTIKRGAGEEPRTLRIETAAISVFTILLICTALSKMVMYINVYGLTQLRVFTSWFMALLLIVFAIICVRQFIKFNSARLIIAGFVVMFVALSYSNADGFIAKYNIERYMAGTLETIDVYVLTELSDAAIPYIYELYINTDESERELREDLAQAISRVYDPGFRGTNYQKYRAVGLLTSF